ncbi:pyruvate kinase [Paenibacillus sp. FSL L8-0436]|uniref:pyruvate kinase n=1 Tax=Paenibacillus sp. FSL L8-0436 TaxID=2954686 RepID=UPI0031593318
MSIDLICTIGPASSSPAVLKELLLSGMTTARLNMSHGSHEEHERVIEALRSAAAESGQPVRIMGDLQGPKIRLKNVKGDAIRLDEGQTFILDQSDEPGSRERAALDNPGVMEDILQGATILINDGEVKLEASHLEEIREFVASLGKYSQPGLISKIETIHAVRNFPSIMEASEGIMIARGDLGVELPFERIPFIQKAILRECSLSKTYVITATQMLQSMVDHPVPTRAEVTDVSQAVMDGSDAVMLSAESSVGHYPVQSTRALNTIAKFAENMREQGKNGFSLEEICSESLFDNLYKGHIK